jgi:hypothetical protein
MNTNSAKKLSVVSSTKSVKAPRAPRVRKTLADLSIVDQVKEAMKPKARLATFLGFLLGGFVPSASYIVAHHELDHTKPLYFQPGLLLVLGGLLYSAKTVYEWGVNAFANKMKALGFVVLLEGVMILSSTPAIAVAALIYLAMINGIATGCNLSLKSGAK